MDIDERAVLKSMLKKCGERVWTGFIWLRIRAPVNTVINLRVL
jgi:hypothetical protein